MKKTTIRTTLFATLPMLVVVAIFTLWQWFSFPVVSERHWSSIFSEGIIALLVLAAWFMMAGLRDQRRIFIPLYWGFAGLYISMLTDLLDEFIQQPGYLTLLFEDYLQVVAYLLLLFGLGGWHKYHLRQRHELQQLAVTDYLTGALNRRGFGAAVGRELERADRYSLPLSILVFDIDYFKQINDRYGHDAGDAVLRRIAQQVRSEIRSLDVFARTGGEEFCVLMPETALPGAVETAEKLRRAFEECQCARSMRVTASFGVGEWQPGESFEMLLKRLDRALYAAKDAGRNRVETSVRAAAA